MDQRLKKLINQLGQAIDVSLSESDAITAVIEEIKEEGYDVLLVLEATIGFNRRSHGVSASHRTTVTHKDLASSLTEKDQEFLKALSISLEE